MTLAAVKKLAIKLPLRQRLQLADALYDSLPLLRGSVGLAELERRADDVISGKVKGIPWEVVKRDLDKMRKSITQKRPPPRRPRHLGRTPGPAISRMNGRPSGVIT